MSYLLHAVRSARLILLAALTAVLLVPATPYAATETSDTTQANTSHTNVLSTIFKAGYARLARGDVKGAAGVFRLVHEVAPSLAGADYALALASSLDDFDKRAEALPLIQAALAADFNNPVGAVISVIADPTMSTLRPDGALYLTPAAVEKLHTAAQQLPSYEPATADKGGNGKYLAIFVNSMANTGDQAFPARIANFSRMKGQNGTVTLGGAGSDVSFGQLFIVAASDATFAPFEQNLVDRMQGGLKSLENSQDSLRRIQLRIKELQSQIASNDPAQRTAAAASLQHLLDDLQDVIVNNEQQIAVLKPIIENIGDQTRTVVQLAQTKKELQEQESALAEKKRLALTMTASLDLTKQSLSDAERKLLQTKKATDDAQTQLNSIEQKVAAKNLEFQASVQTTQDAQQKLAENQQKLHDIAVNQEVLQKRQQVAAQLDDIKRQQTTAAAQLSQLRADVAKAESSKQGDIAALHQQEAGLTAKLASLQSDVAAGEAARQQADQLRQQLASLNTQKGSLESNMQDEQANLARLKAQREALQNDLVAMQRDRDQQLAEQSQNASMMKQVDFGRYFALVIGNDDYQKWPKLKTAVGDATAVANVLSTKYGFKVSLLTNATRAQMLGAMDDLADELGPNDNLLIYYGGHGIEEASGTGYWVPIDADPVIEGHALRTENLVRNGDIIGSIQMPRMKAKQVMIIADSCFSGSLALAAASMQPPKVQLAQGDNAAAGTLRGPSTPHDSSQIETQPGGSLVGLADAPEQVAVWEHWARRPARVVLTSGGNEPVLDQIRQGDKHSVFAQALLDALNNNKSMMKSIELTDIVRDKVVGKVDKAVAQAMRGAPSSIEQTPNFSNLGGFDGDFLFVVKG